MDNHPDLPGTNIIDKEVNLIITEFTLTVCTALFDTVLEVSLKVHTVVTYNMAKRVEPPSAKTPLIKSSSMT